MDKALKQRLVGASVLVALAVLILPMLLGGDAGTPQETRSIDLPPKPRELSFETRRFPVGEQGPEQANVVEPPPMVLEPPPRNEAPVREQIPLPDKPQPVAERPVPAPVVAEEVPPAVVITPAPSPLDDQKELPVAPARAASEPPPVLPVAATTGADGDGRYLVQVASFSSTGNANRLAAQLGEAGLPVLMDTVNSAAGTLHRVQLGPFARRQQADRVIRDLNTRIPDLQPRVLDLRPDDESAANPPSDPLVRWVVQVGSFSDAENAEKLVFSLRDAGFRASSQAVSSAGVTAHKVRVGPVLERDDATELAASIKAKLGLDGLVMSSD
jgi:cell division septation protein DedD